MIEVTRQADQYKCFLKLVLINSRLYTTSSSHSFSRGFLKTFESQNKCIKFINNIKILDIWLQILKNKGIGAFRLIYFYEYKFPANLTNIEMNLDDFFILQQEPYNLI